MEGSGRGIVAVTSTTGLQGGASTRALVRDHSTVLALTRDPGRIEYMRDRGLPGTLLRPQAFMERMMASKYFPPASTWPVMPRLIGGGRPVGWLAAEHSGSIVARVSPNPIA